MSVIIAILAGLGVFLLIFVTLVMTVPLHWITGEKDQ